MRGTTHAELLRMGIDLRDVDQPIGTLSGGERQCVAIARAVYFGAKVLVLDEPTAALGVKQSGVVLSTSPPPATPGLGVVLITHNPHHAYLVGDRFVLLKRGTMAGSHTSDEITLDELTRQMAGGSELDELAPRAGGPRPVGRRAVSRAAPPRGRDQPRGPAAARHDRPHRRGPAPETPRGTPPLRPNPHVAADIGAMSTYRDLAPPGPRLRQRPRAPPSAPAGPPSCGPSAPASAART